MEKAVFDINKKIVAGIIVFSVLIRVLFIYFILYDSDEITWSIIGRRVLSGEDFHIFFLNQKYMGAIEGYIVGIFQAIFGYNLITLRINSLIFSTILTIVIYFLLKKLINIRYALLGTILSNMGSIDITLNYTKAWGNRPFISLVGLLIIISCWYLFLSTEKISDKKRNWVSALTGFFLGLSFWANLENVYFIIFTFLIAGFALFKPYLPHTIKLPKITIGGVISFIFYFLIFWLFYGIFTKKSLFNPYQTLIVKLNVNSEGLKFLDFGFETIFFLLLFYIVAPVKLLIFPAKNKKIRSFSLILSFFTLGAFFSISRNSVARTNQIVNSLSEQAGFMINTIFPQFIGSPIILKNPTFGQILTLISSLTFPVMAVAIIAINKIKELVLDKKLKISLIDTFALYAAIPFLFIFSRAGGISTSARYITNMWPGFVILYVIGVYYLLNLKNKLPLLIAGLVNVITIGTIGYYIYDKAKAVYIPAINDVRNKSYANTDQIRTADFLVKKGIKGCYAGYWNAYPIMFESDYNVICSPAPHFGYGENETPFNTIIVDADPNPAFIFTTQARVDEFYSKWACPVTSEACNGVGKEIKVLESEKIGKYYIFLTRRIGNGVRSR